MTTGDIATIFGTLTTNVGSILTTNLPLVVAILAGLIGLGVLVSYVSSWLSGESGGYMPWTKEGRSYRTYYRTNSDVHYGN